MSRIGEVVEECVIATSLHMTFRFVRGKISGCLKAMNFDYICKICSVGRGW